MPVLFAVLVLELDPRIWLFVGWLSRLLMMETLVLQSLWDFREKELVREALLIRKQRS